MYSQAISIVSLWKYVLLSFDKYIVRVYCQSYVQGKLIVFLTNWSLHNFIYLAKEDVEW